MQGLIERIREGSEDWLTEWIESRRSDGDRSVAEMRKKCNTVNYCLTRLLNNPPLMQDGQVDSEEVANTSALVWNVFPEQVVSLSLPNGVVLRKPAPLIEYRGSDERRDWNLEQMESFMRDCYPGIWEEIEHKYVK